MIIDLVDSIEYARTNCFVHQLTCALNSDERVRTVALGDLQNYPRPEGVICRLKQRTLHRVMRDLAPVLGGVPINIFDQDPWQAYMDDSPYKGVYEQAIVCLNVRTFALTSPRWVDILREKGLPTCLARMWMLPEYCTSVPPFLDRTVDVGFIGSLHPYRKTAFDRLSDLDVNVNVMAGNALPYDQYLKALSNVRIYVRTEDSPIVVDGQPLNLRDGLWGRDIEIAARGCFSIRNSGAGSEAYLDGINTVFIYDSIEQVPRLIRDIETMDPTYRQNLLDASVDCIRQSNGWHQTAATLTDFRSPG
jgi:hypothetical protein